MTSFVRPEDGDSEGLLSIVFTCWAYFADKEGMGQAAEAGKKEDASAPLESKTSKKKKAKKDKSSKEAEETLDQNNVVDNAAGVEHDEDVASVDV